MDFEENNKSNGEHVDKPSHIGAANYFYAQVDIKPIQEHSRGPC